jgi:cell division protein FtsB
MPGRDRDRDASRDRAASRDRGQVRDHDRGEVRDHHRIRPRPRPGDHGHDRHRDRDRDLGQVRAPGRDRFSTTTRLRLLGQQTAARVYRSQSRRQARRSRLTGRAALLTLVLCSLIVALAYPMRQYVSQRAEIDALQRQREANRARVEHLRDLKARWQDDAYAEQQIRNRLHYVKPGETGYTMLETGIGQQSNDEEGVSSPAGQPWYANMWETVDKSDRAATIPRPTPEAGQPRQPRGTAGRTATDRTTE